MKPADKSAFSQLLSASLDVYGAKPSTDAVAVWWGAMAGYDFDAVRRAMAEHVQDPASGRFPPKPADLIGRIQANDGWIGPEEAWSLVSQTINDERVTVFWTSPMQQAFGVALALRDDLVAARMSFKEIYSRSVSKARAAGEKPTWQISPGSDVGMRDAAIEEAVRLGRISSTHGVKLLSHQSETPLADLADWLDKQLPKLTAVK